MSQQTQGTTKWTASRLFGIGFYLIAAGLLLIFLLPPTAGIGQLVTFAGVVVCGFGVHKLVRLVEWYMLRR